MNIFIDFETAYSSQHGYTLSKMSAEEYIRDKRFKAFGCGVKIDSGQAVWVPADRLDELFKQEFWARANVVAHNAAFDLSIAVWRFGLRAKQYRCTRSMTSLRDGVGYSASLNEACDRRGLGAKHEGVLEGVDGVYEPSEEQLAKLAEYCVQDVELCAALYEKLTPHFDATDYHYMNAVLRMMIQPRIMLDKGVLKSTAAEEAERKAALVCHLPDDQAEIIKAGVRSPKTLALWLKQLGVEVPMKQGKNGLIPAFAKTDAAFTALAEHPNEAVRTLVQLRLTEKGTLVESRAAKLSAIAERGPWPIELPIGRTVTGRLAGGGGVNPQNLPREGGLRKALRAPVGMTFVVGDLSQIEMRVGAWLAGAQHLLDTMGSGGDVYSEVMSRILGRPIGKDDPERQNGKILQLSCQFGGGAVSIQKQARAFGQSLSLDESERMKRQFRDSNPQYVSAWRTFGEALESDDYKLPKGMYWHRRGDDHRLRLPSGRTLVYTDLCHFQREVEKDGKVEFITDDFLSYQVNNRRGGSASRHKIYSANLFHNAVQATAADVLARAIAALDRRYAGCYDLAQPVLQVHDELVLVARKDQAGAVATELKRCLVEQPSWLQGCPLDADIGVGDVYGEAK